MDEIEAIETEWGGVLHRELIALEMKVRVAWRDSPAAREEMLRFKEATGREIAPMELAPAHQESLNLPVYVWV